MDFQLVLNNNRYNCSEEIVTDNLRATLHYYANDILRQSSSIKKYRNFVFWRAGRISNKSNIRSIIDKLDAISIERLNSIEVASALKQIGKQILDQVSDTSFCRFYCRVVLIFNRAFPSIQQNELKKLSTAIFENNFKTVLTPLYKNKDVFQYMLSFINIKEHPALLVINQKINNMASSILLQQNESLADLHNRRIMPRVNQNMYDILYHILLGLPQELIQESTSQLVNEQIIFFIGISKSLKTTHYSRFNESEETLSLYKQKSDFVFKIAFNRNLLTSNILNRQKSENYQFFTITQMSGNIDNSVLGSEITNSVTDLRIIMDKTAFNLNSMINKLVGQFLEQKYESWIENIFNDLESSIHSRN